MNIKKVIKQKGFTIKRVAESMGITQSALSQQLNNKSITIERAKEIAGVLGISLSELVVDEDAPASTTITCPVCGASYRLTAELDNEHSY